MNPNTMHHNNMNPSSSPWFANTAPTGPTPTIFTPQLNTTTMGRTTSGGLDDDYALEPPLLEELGINFDHIWTKTKSVLQPNKPISEHILDDTDLAGPLFFCFLFGIALLLVRRHKHCIIYS